MGELRLIRLLLHRKDGEGDQDATGSIWDPSVTILLELKFNFFHVCISHN